MYRLLALIGRYWPFPHGTGWLVEKPARLVRNWPRDKRFRLKDGRIFQGDLNDLLFRTLYLYGDYEPLASKALSCLVKPGDTVVDVGANVGVVSTLLGRLVSPTGQVYSFEPVPPVFEKLKLTINLNGLDSIIKAFNLAVSQDNETQATMYVPQLHSHACSSFKVDNPELAIPCICPAVSLNNASFIKQLPALVKVDVEGAELLVLQGAEKWCLDERPPIWMLEINRIADTRFNYQPEDLVDHFATYDYRQFFWSDNQAIYHFIPGMRFNADGTLFALPQWAIDEGRINSFNRI